MKIIEAKESIRPLWEDFNRNSLYSSFLQSWSWGDFQKAQGSKIYRLAFEESKLKGGFTAKARVVGIAQVIKQPLPFGKSYLYLPHAPIIDEKQDKEKAWQLLIDYTKNLAKIDKSFFLLTEPKQNFDSINLLKKSNKHIQAETTLILDIQGKKFDILNQMKSKTRYNIRLAKRKGIKIFVSKNLDDISIFLRMAKMTSKRDEFRLHPDNYYRDMVKELSKEGLIELLLARYKKRWVAAILVIYYGPLATYLHGASDYRFHQFMAPHLLQWTAIRRAHKRGCRYYDFWGVAKTDDPHHQWAGFTRFKTGFAPKTRMTEYPGPYEYIYNPIGALAYKTTQKLLGRR